MTGLRDAKHITTREDDAARGIAWALVAVIALLTAYSCTSDVPARQVVMSRAEFERVVAQARMDAAREAINAKECMPGDEFRHPPRALRKYAPKGPL